MSDFLVTTDGDGHLATIALPGGGAGGGPHAASHAIAGGDAVSPASIGADTPALRDAALATHEADTLGVHGIADTAALATDVEVVTGLVPYPRAYRKTGNYIFPLAAAVPAGGGLILDSMRAFPLYVPPNTSIDRIAIRVSTAVATSLTRMGIYLDNGAGMPGALLLDAGTVDCGTIGIKEITVNQALPAEGGLIWVAGVAQVLGSTVYRTIAGIYLPAGMLLSDSLLAPTGYSIEGVSGVLPDPFGVPTNVPVNTPRIGLRMQ